MCCLILIPVLDVVIGRRVAISLATPPRLQIELMSINPEHDPENDQNTLYLIKGLKSGDEQAVHAIYERYVNRFHEIITRRLRGRVNRIADEEDVSNSVLNSFFMGVNENRFPSLNDSDDLWQILGMLTKQKIVKYLRYFHRQKRGSGLVRGDSVFDSGAMQNANMGPDHPRQTPQSPDAQMMEHEYLASLMDSLPNERIQEVAMMRLNGYSNQEIADQLDTSVRSVGRKLSLIRAQWSQVLKAESEEECD